METFIEVLVSYFCVLITGFGIFKNWLFWSIPERVIGITLIVAIFGVSVYITKRYIKWKKKITNDL